MVSPLCGSGAQRGHRHYPSLGTDGSREGRCCLRGGQDTAGCNQEALSKMADLARNDVPLLHVCGSIDPVLGRAALPVERIYHQFGRRISTMLKEGAGHHPHSLRDPTLIADFITQSVQSTVGAPPDFVADTFTRTSFYSLQNVYREFPPRGACGTCRGPLFTGILPTTVFLGSPLPEGHGGSTSLRRPGLSLRMLNNRSTRRTPASSALRANLSSRWIGMRKSG